MKKVTRILCLAGAAAMAAGLVLAHGKPWPVPEEFKKMKNPVAKDAAGMKAAAAIYTEKCAQCHGDTGKGDGPEAEMYSTKPANFTDAAMMGEMTEGELYYKMTEGRRPMPTFKKQLTDQQRWQLVNYIRAFAPAEKKPAKTQPHKH